MRARTRPSQVVRGSMARQEESAAAVEQTYGRPMIARGRKATRGVGQNRGRRSDNGVDDCEESGGMADGGWGGQGMYVDGDRMA